MYTPLFYCCCEYLQFIPVHNIVQIIAPAFTCDKTDEFTKILQRKRSFCYYCAKTAVPHCPPPWEPSADTAVSFQLYDNLTRQLISIYNLLITHIYGPGALAVLHDLYIREALDILLKLGKSVISYLKVPKPRADPIPQRSEGDPVSPVRLYLPEDIFLHHLLPALILVKRN